MPFFVWLFAALSSAHAVPIQLTQQGRLLDNAGVAVSGTHAMAFRLYDNQMGGNMVWEEVLNVNLVNGYYTAVLGDSSSNPLDDSYLSAHPLFMEIEIGGNGPIGSRQAVVSAPYSRLAGTAANLDGGMVNAAEVSVGGQLVIDAAGSWVGPALAVNWADVQGIPSDIADGDDDSLAALSCGVGQILGWGGADWICTDDNGLTESEVEAYVSNDAIDLHVDTTVGGLPILTEGADNTLGGLSCQSGEVAKWDNVLGSWVCEVDLDTVLSETDVEGYVSNAPIDLAAGSMVGGEAITTHATDQDTMSQLSCSADQVAVWSGSVWTCSDQSASGSVPLSQPAPCDTNSIGQLWYDVPNDELLICNGTSYAKIKICTEICPPDSDFACGSTVTDDCGANCGTVGTGLNATQCEDPLNISCNQDIYDDCGNDCGFDGSAYDSTQCPLEDAVTCGQPVTDDCGNVCGYEGTLCGSGETCSNGVCLSCVGGCCGLDQGSDQLIMVDELNDCLQTLGAAFYQVEYIEVAYGYTNYLDNICQEFGYNFYSTTYGGDTCSGWGYQYPSHCNQGWLGNSCGNGCGNTNYAGFYCN